MIGAKTLNSLIERWKIDLVYPSNSTVIDAILKNRHGIAADVVLPQTSVVALTRSKRSTLERLEDVVPVPKTYVPNAKDYPVFVKPDYGYGAQDSVLVSSANELEAFLLEKETNKYLIQEFLPGKEYTVDCFSSRKGELLFCEARERARIRMGTSMRSVAAPKAVQDIARDYGCRIMDKIRIRGAWFFQIKEASCGTLKLLEVDIRIAGTMVFNRVMGINFPLLTIYDHLGCDVKIGRNDFQRVLERGLVNRFRVNVPYDTVYVDLDDTLIVRDQVNTQLIQFLFQCLNKGKRITLVSKSLEKDKVGYLRSFRLSQLFDEVIWLSEKESKADYINTKSAIFIDDSFSQRMEVAEVCGIPTFDCSMLEILIDERE